MVDQKNRPTLTSSPSGRTLSEAARHLTLPEGIVGTKAPVVERELRRLRMNLDPWQYGLHTAILGVRSDGMYACGVGGAIMSIPRQTGKTYTIGALVFALSLAEPDTTTIWTAHRARTHRETFQSMTALADRKSIKPHIASVRKANGEQEITFKNGSQILFGAREAGFGRGFAEIDILILDEAQILSEKAMEDMVPATNAAPNPLVIFAGTPPRPDDPGEVFSQRREDALAGDPDSLYVEMSADPDGDPDDPAQWSKANPSYPFRTPETAIRRMRKLLGSLLSFKREGLGIWDSKDAGAKAFPAAVWTSGHQEPPKDGTRSLGIKFSPDGLSVALAGAVKTLSGRIHVEAIREEPMSSGTAWLVDWVVDRKSSIAAVAIDGRAGASFLAAALRDAKIAAKAIILPNVDQAIAAHQGLDQGLREGTITHSGQAELDAQATSAIRRNIGKSGGFGWDSAHDGQSVGLLDAVTMAAYAAKTTKRRPGRSQRFL